MNAPSLEQKIDALTGLVGELVERQRQQQELLDELMPISKEVMAFATTRLDELDRAGWFAMGRELVGMMERVVDAYEPEDVHELGESVVTILDAVRAVTQPEVMALVAEAGEALQHGDELEPKSPWEVLQSTRDLEVQRGMAVMVEVLKQVGRASERLGPTHADGGYARRRRLLDRRTAPRGVRRARVAIEAPVAAPAPAAKEPPMHLEGFELCQAGFLIDPSTWTEEFAARMADACGVAELTEVHWQVIRFARSDWAESGASPNIRRITTGCGVSTKELYAMWPAAPGKTTARIAGLHKPAGCL